MLRAMPEPRIFHGITQCHSSRSSHRATLVVNKNLFISACIAQEIVHSLLVSKADKPLAKIMNPQQARNVTFEEAVSVLEHSGFVWDLGTGSHQVYRHPDGRRVTLPKHGNLIKPVYIHQIRELLKSPPTS